MNMKINRVFGIWTHGICRYDNLDFFDFLTKFRIWKFSVNFGPTSPCWGQNRCILSLYFGYLTVFWVSELVFRVSEPILWVSELISLVLGVWTYTLGVWTYIACVGCLNLYFWASEDQAFWGPLNLEILKDQAFWYDLWIWKYWRT